MAKQIPITIEGKVLEAMGGGIFKVKLKSNHEIIAHPSGKMRMNMINILPGDAVIVEMSIYDLQRGRIVQRYISNMEK